MACLLVIQIEIQAVWPDAKQFSVDKQCSLITSVSNFCYHHQNLLQFYSLPKLLLEFMPFDPAWNSTTDVFDQIPHFCHFVLHIAVNTNVSEGFVFTAIWSTDMEGRPADCFVLHIAVKPIIPLKTQRKTFSSLHF